MLFFRSLLFSATGFTLLCCASAVLFRFRILVQSIDDGFEDLVLERVDGFQWLCVVYGVLHGVVA